VPPRPPRPESAPGHPRPLAATPAAERGSDEGKPGDAADCTGRVVARFGQRYIVALDPSAAEPTGEVDAIARGRRLSIVVGDRVHCRLEHGLCVIEGFDERRNLLFRADANRTKPLAANVDQLAIVFAAQPPPQPEFAWRALLAARAADIAPIAILNKIDLESSAALIALEELAQLGARALRLSARADPQAAAAQLRQVCQDRVTLFVGQSGMGKSTLLNLLIDSKVRTGALSRRGTRGRQTTTLTRWFAYGPKGALIDSPGFHEFGLGHLSAADLARYMPDLAAESGNCRFANCRHAEEPDCQVRAAVERGQIRRARYEFYRRLLAQEVRAKASSPRR